MKTLWINIDQYAKMLNFSQAELMRMLFEHLVEEKIEFATESQLSNDND